VGEGERRRRHYSFSLFDLLSSRKKMEKRESEVDAEIFRN
jgi:hypothetical protein